VRRLWELEEGREYSVVLTTGGGLWRYRLHDLVRVNGFHHRTPCFTFLGKDNAVCDLVGEKLDERHVAEALRIAESAAAISANVAMLAPAHQKAPCGYVIYLETSTPSTTAQLARFAAALELELCRNYHYAHARNLGQLHPLRLFYVHGDAISAYRAMLGTQGVKAGDIKPPALSLRPLCTTSFRGEWL
jgi:hypothetical protein